MGLTLCWFMSCAWSLAQAGMVVCDNIWKFVLFFRYVIVLFIAVIVFLCSSGSV